jgi:dihydroorotase
MVHTALLIQGGRILDPAQDLDLIGDLLVDNGQVLWIRPSGSASHLPTAYEMVDARGLLVTPGFVDLHCHLREPGFEHKETIATGTRAAAKGGFTTVCSMPNTEPAVDTAALVDYVTKRANETAIVRVLPIGCITRGRAGTQLAEMVEMAQAGAVAFSDDGDPVGNAHLMRQALSYSQITGLPVINHCEDKTISQGGVMNQGVVASRLGLRGTPPAAEEAMVARDIALAELTGGKLHLAHLSTAGSVALVERAKERGIPITAEVTPHHLVLTEEWVLGYQGASRGWLSTPLYDTSTKVNPPLRTTADVEALRRGLKNGVIDAIATDHAPHARLDKLSTYDDAAFGISGLETALGLLMTTIHEGDLDLSTLIRRITTAPAVILGRPVGNLRDNTSADITIINPDQEWIVDPKSFVGMGQNTPLGGMLLKGKVVATMFGGDFVHNELDVKTVHQ